MPTPLPLLDAGAAELAAALRERRATVAAHTEGVLRRIAERNPSLCAISQVRGEAAGAEAAALDGLDDAAAARLPLFGVPVAIKEEIPVAGLVTTFGGRGNSAPAPADAAVVGRLRAAGAVIVATTHMSEFGQTPFTDGGWGATLNPWDPARSPGGSSGGSAAAVAARLVPLAMGGDSGGSVRIPAAWCGVLGLKPGRGRLPTDPVPDLWYRLGTYGPLARRAADLRLAFRVLAGEAAGWPDDAAGVSGGSASGAGGAAPLRVGWTTSCPLPGVRASAEVTGAVEAAARALAAAGHAVTRGSVRWAGTPSAFLAQCYRGVLDEARRVDHPELLERRSRQTAALGRLVSDRALDRALRVSDAMADASARLFERLDVLLMPVAPTVAPPARDLAGVGTLRAQAVSTAAIAFTSYWNLAGNPAASVPVGLSAGGLPLAVQVVGPRGREDRVLDVAEQITAAPRPPRFRR